MRILINHFKCWGQQDLNIRDEELILIKGQSGAGKTTVLQAIYWCLYGTLRKASPNSDPKAQTCVMIEMPTMTIIRKKNLGLLRLILNEGYGPVEYQDQVAQQIIDQRFGTGALWMACCYVMQGLRNSFLTSSAGEKMELLNRLAFNAEDPAIYITRIDAQIGQTQGHFDTGNAIWTRESQQFQMQIAGRQIQAERARTIEQVGSLNQELNTSQLRLQMLQQIHMSREKELAVITNLQAMIQTNRERLERLTGMVLPAHLIGLDLNQRLTELEQKKRLQLNLAQIAHELKQVQLNIQQYQDIAIENSIQENDLPAAQHQERLVRENKLKSQQANVAYETTAISTQINKIQTQLDQQPRLKVQAEVKRIKERLSKLAEAKFPAIAELVLPVELLQSLNQQLQQQEQNLVSERDKLQHQERACTVLSCPHCQKPVRYMNGSIVSSDLEPVTMADLQACRAKYQMAEQAVHKLRMEKHQLEAKMLADKEQHLKRTAELEMFKRQVETEKKMLEEQLLRLTMEKLSLEEVTEHPLSEMEARQLAQTLQMLRSIILLDEPVFSSQFLSRALAKKVLRQREELLNKQHQDLLCQTSSDDFGAEMQQIRDLIASQAKFEAERKAALDNIQRNEADLSKRKALLPEDPALELQQISQHIQALQEEISVGQFTTAVLQRYQQLSQQQQQLQILHQRLVSLRTLRQQAIEVECYTLQNLVDGINASIADIASTLFTKPITITLHLHKTVKSTQHVKPAINFTVNYEGGEYDNINQLSGGEADRASLALILSLVKQSACPFLLLDESLASLDPDLKEAAIKAIREHAHGKTVIVVMHETIEGLYDQVISI
jgi:DNA repair exonuclease SbcCD ATPase subunit